MCKPCYKEKRKKNRLNKKEVVCPSEKLCNSCNMIKPSSIFKKNTRSLDGLFNKCNDCWKPREWNKEKQKQSEKNILRIIQKRSEINIEDKVKKHTDVYDRV